MISFIANKMVWRGSNNGQPLLGLINARELEEIKVTMRSCLSRKEWLGKPLGEWHLHATLVHCEGGQVHQIPDGNHSEAKECSLVFATAATVQVVADTVEFTIGETTMYSTNNLARVELTLSSPEEAAKISSKLDMRKLKMEVEAEEYPSGPMSINEDRSASSASSGDEHRRCPSSISEGDNVPRGDEAEYHTFENTEYN